jgi:hypothetical protein
MESEVIPIRYGLHYTPTPTHEQIAWLDEERAATERDYPNSLPPYWEGGCVLRKAQFARVNYCPKCRKADESWHWWHGRSPLAEDLPRYD